MKIFKNVFVFSLLICFVFTSTSTVSAMDNLDISTSKSDSDISNILSDSDLHDYEKSLPESTQIAIKEQKYPLDAYTNLVESFSKTLDGEINFPSNYAGSFIEGDKLIISVVNLSDEVKKDYLKRCKISDCVVFREVENSISDLEAARKEAYKLGNDGFDIISTGIDVQNNQLTIGLNKEKHSLLLQQSTDNTDLPFISFPSLISDQRKAQLKLSELPVNVQLTSPVMSCVSVKGGNKLTNGRGTYGSSFTCGVAGKYLGKNAILTCGHGNEMEVSVSYNGTVIGKSAYWRANTQPSFQGKNAVGDFAIVLTNSNVTLSRTLSNNVSISSANAVPTGTTVTKYGATAGLATGKVAQVGITLKYSGTGMTTYYVNGLMKVGTTTSATKNPVQPGDSGGPVYNSSSSKYNFNGIITASDKSKYNNAIWYWYVTSISWPKEVGFTVKTS